MDKNYSSVVEPPTEGPPLSKVNQASAKAQEEVKRTSAEAQDQLREAIARAKKELTEQIHTEGQGSGVSIAGVGGVALAGGVTALAGGVAASSILSEKPAVKPAGPPASEIIMRDATFKNLKDFGSTLEQKSFPLSADIQGALGERTSLIKEIIEKAESGTLTQDAVGIYGKRLAEIHARIGKETLRLMRENNVDESLARGLFMHTAVVSSVDSMLERMLATEIVIAASPSLEGAAAAQETFVEAFGRFQILSDGMDNLRLLLKSDGDRGEIDALLNDMVSQAHINTGGKVEKIVSEFDANNYPPALSTQSDIHKSISAKIEEIKGIGADESSALKTANELLNRYLSLRETIMKKVYVYVASLNAEIAGANGTSSELVDLFRHFRDDDDYASGLLESFRITFEPYLTPEMSGYLGDMRKTIVATEDRITEHAERRRRIDIARAFEQDPGMKLRAGLALGENKIPEDIFRDAPKREVEQEVSAFFKNNGDENIELADTLRRTSENAMDSVFSEGRDTIATAIYSTIASNVADLSSSLGRTGVRLIKNIEDVKI